MTLLAEIAPTTGQPINAAADIDIGYSGPLADRIRASTARAVELKEQGKFREMHREAREVQIREAQGWIEKAWCKRSCWFADGGEINPRNISPMLVEVKTTEQQDLFRLARYTWSLPYSRGYGRRLRFLVVDEGHNTLMGVLGLQSAPISFSPRDRRVEYPEERKVELVNQTMDAFTLGAVPPYNRLLGGKLVVAAAASREIVEAYGEKYSGATTWMDGRTIPPHLVMITTTSAFGRSSIYNRATYQDPETGSKRKLAYPLGYTQGYGSVHLHREYKDIKKFLVSAGYDASQGYGSGPKPVWQNISKTLTMLGMGHEGLRHGIPREAWCIPLAENAWDYLGGQGEDPEYYDVPFERLAEWWTERWLLPRSERITDWREWRKDHVLKSISIKVDTATP